MLEDVFNDVDEFMEYKIVNDEDDETAEELELYDDIDADEETDDLSSNDIDFDADSR